jgi:hypothetical protein
VGPITGATDPVPVATQLSVSAAITDVFPPAYVAIWDWGDSISPNSESTPEACTDDGTKSMCTVTGSHAYEQIGVYEISLVVKTDDNRSSDPVFQSVVIYDPTAGFVTGGGWIDSPVNGDYQYMQVGGKVTFGFVSKYKKGASTPDGNTEFQFKAGDLNFHSTSYDWLLVTGSDYAKFKGTGTINGGGEYKFKTWAGDDDPDTFRIKIWEEDGNGNETVTYDNGADQAIAGGSIVIHTKGK